MVKSPISVLIEAHHLSGERHAKRGQQQKNTAYPCQFARILVSAEQKDLDHVQRHDRHHEVRSPVMHGAQVPAPELDVVQILKAGVSLVGRRNVYEREACARDDLNDKQSRVALPKT